MYVCIQSYKQCMQTINNEMRFVTCCFVYTGIDLEYNRMLSFNTHHYIGINPQFKYI